MSEEESSGRVHVPAESLAGAHDDARAAELSPCLRCGWPLPVRLMGCKGGRCPNCGHHYPHGDCSD